MPPLSPPCPLLIQEDGEAEDHFASRHMDPAIYILPHGPCIPRPCRPHLAAKPCPTMPLLIQKEARHELRRQAWFRAMSAPLSTFTLFSSKNILFILVIFLYLFFIKKWKSRQKHRKPLCRNGFQVSTFCFLVPFLWTGAPLHPTLHQTKSRRNGVQKRCTLTSTVNSSAS